MRTPNNTHTTPSIYVASLSDYNNGILHGTWVDATQGYDAIQEEIQEILDTSPTAAEYGEKVEEWVIHDYEGFYIIRLGEYENLEHVAELAEAIEEHGEPFAHYYEVYCSSEDTQTCIRGFEDEYQGEYNSEEDFAESLIDDLGMLGDMSENMRYYFDYERFAHDLFISDYDSCSLEDGSVAVFRR